MIVSTAVHPFLEIKVDLQLQLELIFRQQAIS
jgi:hypothetical protein